MKKLTSILIITCITVFTSCINFKTKESTETIEPEDFNTVVINNDYSVGIPKFMRATTGLNEEASLQYQNMFKETYVIVIDEQKVEFVDILKEMGQYDESKSLIQNYRDIQLQLLAGTMQFSNESEPKSLKINGLDAEMVTVDAMVDGIDEGISYFLTFLDGSDKVYMMMAWTLQSKKEDYRETYGAIAETFQLVDWILGQNQRFSIIKLGAFHLIYCTFYPKPNIFFWGFVYFSTNLEIIPQSYENNPIRQACFFMPDYSTFFM